MLTTRLPGKRLGYRENVWVTGKTSGLPGKRLGYRENVWVTGKLLARDRPIHRKQKSDQRRASADASDSETIRRGHQRDQPSNSEWTWWLHTGDAIWRLNSLPRRQLNKHPVAHSNAWKLNPAVCPAHQILPIQTRMVMATLHISLSIMLQMHPHAELK